jgi:hypothetical protein
VRDEGGGYGAVCEGVCGEYCLGEIDREQQQREHGFKKPDIADYTDKPIEV